MTTDELFSAVLQLPPEARLELADALWSSLDRSDDFQLTGDAELDELIRNRCKELDSGNVVPVSHDEVMSRMNEALARCSSAITPPSPTN